MSSHARLPISPSSLTISNGLFILLLNPSSSPYLSLERSSIVNWRIERVKFGWWNILCLEVMLDLKNGRTSNIELNRKHRILILSICFRDNTSILFVKMSSAIWKGRLESFNRMKISIYVTLNKKYSSYFSFSSYVKMNNEVRNNTYFIRERDVDNDFNEYSVMERYLNVLSSA